MTDWISAIGGTAGFAALLVTTYRERRRRSAPPAQMPELLLELERAFSDIIATGGADTYVFLDPARQSSMARLAVTAGAIVDDKLNAAVAEARNSYLDCWAYAPAPGAPGGSSLLARQVEAAHAGRTHVVRAIERMNLLIRKYSAGSP